VTIRSATARAISALAVLVGAAVIAFLLIMAAGAAFYAFSYQSGTTFVSLLIIMLIMFGAIAFFTRLLLPFAKRQWGLD
jgi:hypothetical protein